MPKSEKTAKIEVFTARAMLALQELY